MLLGYNTNGLAFHRWQDGLELLAEVGFRAVAITVDQHCLNPFASNFASELAEMRRTLERLQLRSVIETGARFLLDPRQKHEPTLISSTAEQRSRRVDFLCRCVDIVKELNSDAVSFWSGVWRMGTLACPSSAAAESGKSAQPPESAWQWLLDGCRRVTDYAEQRGVQLAFEPEPGMLVETNEQYGQLAEQVGSPRFGLTIDIGQRSTSAMCSASSPARSPITYGDGRSRLAMSTSRTCDAEFTSICDSATGRSTSRR
ncbi:MAG: xylose isomerase [Planctomycetota bacterium]|nr:MAG: xylose isomerase [Planctomycetota bacterium]